MSADAKRNREQFPACAQFLDGMREAFGPDVRMVWAMENGHEAGRADVPGGVAVPLEQMVLTRPENPATNNKGKK